MKVLIADDERYIRNGLESNIDWSELGIQEVLIAEDGRMALELCREERPEIIISDIKMPGMTGLELAEEVIEKYGARKVILLSGYSEFEYAKKAISIGVVDYLLKPVNLSELRERLQKSIKEIEQENASRETVKQQEIWKALVGKEEKLSIRKLLYDEKVPFYNELVVVTAEQNQIYGVDAGKRIIKYEGFLEENMKILFNKEDKISFLVELNSSDARMQYRHIISRAVRMFAGELSYGTDKSVSEEPLLSAGVSGRGTLSEIRHLYQQSESALGHRMYQKKSVCIFYDEIEIQKDRIYPLLYFDKNSVKDSISLFQRKRLDELIHVQFRHLYEKKCTDGHAPAELCTAIKNAVFEVMQEKGVDIAGILDKNQDMFQEQLRFSFLDSYERWICDYCSLLLMGLEDLSGKKYSSVISRAVDYIHQHYPEDITLKSMAEEVHKSPSYFSCIFKKEMGINFNEYLNQVRIQKAKQLLKMPDAVIYQISEKVGFHDYKYFQKCLKRYVDVLQVNIAGGKEKRNRKILHTIE